MEHGDEPLETEMEHEDSEMSEDHHDCPHCGLLFACNSTLRQHIEKCPNKPIPTSDVFGAFDDVDDAENEDAWVHLIAHLNGRFKDDFEQKRQEYTEAGISDKKAYRLAKKELKASFKEKMKSFARNSLVFNLELRNSRFFEEILEDLIYFKKEKGLDWNNAVTAALDQNFDIFGKVLKARDIEKRIRGEADTDTEDSQESDDEDETESSDDEEIEQPLFP